MMLHHGKRVLLFFLSALLLFSQAGAENARSGAEADAGTEVLTEDAENGFWEYRSDALHITITRFQETVKAIDYVGILALMEFSPAKNIKETESHYPTTKGTHIRRRIFIKQPFRPSVNIMGKDIGRRCILFIAITINSR